LTGFLAVQPSVDISIAPSFIQTLLAGDEGFAGLVLRNVTPGGGTFAIWTSRADSPENFPTLAIEYEVVPEPGTLLLVGTVLAACGRRALRRASGRPQAGSVRLT
jgi:hypothetical protein